MGISLIIILAGLVATYVLGGFNLGIDFAGGLTEQFQIAEVAFNATYTGPSRFEGIIANQAVQVTIGDETRTYLLADYNTINALAEELRKTENMTVDVKPEFGQASPVGLLSTSYLSSAELKSGFTANIGLDDESQIFTSIDRIRDLLEPVGEFNIQQIGDSLSQEFSLKLFVQEEDLNALSGTQGGESGAAAQEDQKSKAQAYQTNVEEQLVKILNSEYGEDTVILRKGDFVGPTFSKEIFQSAFISIIFVILLILVYVSIRFRLDFAIGAILALVHDVLIMVTVIGVLRLEVNYVTIAAILTIVGYSINDTIVVYDRIRENMKLLREMDGSSIMNISITQSLSRTIITSLTTVIAVSFIFIFTTGVIKDFAFNLIIGILSGSYSSVFIAAPVVLLWQKKLEKDKGIKKMDEKSVKKETGEESESITSEVSGEYSAEEKDGKPVRIQRLKKKKKKKK